MSIAGMIFHEYGARAATAVQELKPAIAAASTDGAAAIRHATAGELSTYFLAGAGNRETNMILGPAFASRQGGTIGRLFHGTESGTQARQAADFISTGIDAMRNRNVTGATQAWTQATGLLNDIAARLA